MKYVFEKPYNFEDKEYKEIEIPIEDMKGSDFAAAKKRFSKDGNYAIMPAADSEFCAQLGAKMAKVPVEFFEQMPVKEYCKITQEISNFLLG